MQRKNFEKNILEVKGYKLSKLNSTLTFFAKKVIILIFNFLNNYSLATCIVFIFF